MESATAMTGTSRNLKPPSASLPPIRPTFGGSAWDQRDDENDLWYARFLRYVAIGPGRSVSLVVTGRKNAYPLPAHWPAQAKQLEWKVRADAFDAAAKATPSLIVTFNNILAAYADAVPNSAGKEGVHLRAAVAAGGYQTPPADDEAL